MSDTSTFGGASSAARLSRVRAMLRQTLECAKYGAEFACVATLVGVGSERSLMKGGSHFRGRCSG